MYSENPWWVLTQLVCSENPWWVLTQLGVQWESVEDFTQLDVQWESVVGSYSGGVQWESVVGSYSLDMQWGFMVGSFEFLFRYMRSKTFSQFCQLYFYDFDGVPWNTKALHFRVVFIFFFHCSGPTPCKTSLNKGNRN